MARQFDVPDFYRSPVVSRVKAARRDADPRKKDLSPSVLDFGPLRVKLARHFGFCFGVENAIEIAYRALDENPEMASGGRIFLLSEMIHNSHVNEDLVARGIRFLRTTTGEQLIPYDDLRPGDIVIIPAFGAPPEIVEDLRARGIEPKTYDTTCPFVVRVWKKSAHIGAKGYTVVVHGKRNHEETRATFGHAKESAPVVVVRDMEETEALAAVIEGREGVDFFWSRFEGRTSDGFDPARDLARLGVVNQTTMLATETAAIAERVREAVVTRDGDAGAFADTSDTLCYATKENQDATLALIEAGADLALVVGGYNSSNTSHLVELCEDAGLPTYFISDADDMVSPREIRHFDWRVKEPRVSPNWLPPEASGGGPLGVILTAGASCPDALLDEVIRRLLLWFPDARSVDEAVEPFAEEAA
ncbi:4-hydroxy-3-methylbut-2-enyl diphosphate reductase [Rubricoccus marinus]|uniref:4-hydroxy-3-methylbut-2-enyl diphosphate reductase n=1 Tax=Rubricoccus marinus TaxID=716817 RepID=A0A259U1M4_9BACT|nr:4-hydroxy-3-methylbut-2-enyl diphosphate reductase [Rubricoccus marinus]OZC03871.1 4-hydroxy-3-methylbut-2-enyl diphosphate reductase [Rubricoccus marinus]